MENTVDPAHFYWLHAYTGGHQANERDDLEDERFEVETFEYGIYKYHHRPNTIEIHPLVFPNIRRGPKMPSTSISLWMTLTLGSFQ